MSGQSMTIGRISWFLWGLLVGLFWNGDNE